MQALYVLAAMQGGKFICSEIYGMRPPSSLNNLWPREAGKAVETSPLHSMNATVIWSVNLTWLAFKCFPGINTKDTKHLLILPDALITHSFLLSQGDLLSRAAFMAPPCKFSDSGLLLVQTCASLRLRLPQVFLHWLRFPRRLNTTAASANSTCSANLPPPEKSWTPSEKRGRLLVVSGDAM